VRPALAWPRNLKGNEMAKSRRIARALDHPVQRAIAPLVGLAVTAAAWWIAVSALHVHAFLLPPPAEVVRAFTQRPAYLMDQTGVTATESGLGFLIAAGIGLVIGAMLAASTLLTRTFLPLLVAGNAAPKVALLPLLTAWLGFGLAPKLVMVVLLAVFPMILATAAGLSSTPSDLVELGESLTATRWKSFRLLRFPHALAQIFVGAKIAMPLAVVGAVIGELGNSSEGLGYVLALGAGGGDVPLAFACFVLCALLGIVLYYAVVAIEWLVVPWARPANAAGR
jgi:NitT/TauT family transport system permease protein